MDVKRSLRLLCALLIAPSVPMAAQTTRPAPAPNVSPCEDSTSATYRARLRIDLDYDGPDRTEMWRAVEFAVFLSGTCLASRIPQGPADSAIYGKLRILSTDGAYEIATALGGPRAPRGKCESPRAATTRANTPIVWGVLLSHAVRNFVACVQTVRGFDADENRSDSIAHLTERT